MGVDQNISACERYNRRSTANQSQPQRWQSRRDFVLSNVMCIENKIDISIDIEIYTSHKPVQRSILWFIVRGAGRTCRGAWSISSCGQILHVLPLFPAPQKSVGLFSCSAGPSIFQIGCCHAPAFVLIEPLHDGIILAFFRLLAVPPCIGKISSSPLSVSNCFPFNFWKAFQWPLAIGISKSMVFHPCGANVQSRVPGVNL